MGQVKSSNIINMSILKVFIPNSLCVFSQIKNRKYIEQNFHSVARVMSQGWDLWVLGGVENFSVGICDGAPSTARSSIIYNYDFSNIYELTEMTPFILISLKFLFFSYR